MVNPWNTVDLADAIHVALTLPPQECQDRLRGIVRHITTHTAAHWGKAFIKEFQRAAENSAKITRTPPLPCAEVIKAFLESKRRLLMFAYDGTLVPYSALPSLCRPPRALLNCLTRLSENEANEVYLLSGRDRKTMSQWFSGLKIGLSAEYGYFLRKPLETHWTELAQSIDLSWKETIKPIFQYYTRRTPGTSVEETEMHLTWHYRNADPVFGGIQARELLTYLDNLPLDVVLGDHALAVRSRSVNPTATVRRVISEMQEKSLDFLLIIGDTHINPPDLPSLEGKVYTCAVGRKTNREKYYFNDTRQVIDLVSTLAQLSEKETQDKRGTPKAGVASV
jgi:trehalose 6-phosphate synthase/phosphatase